MDQPGETALERTAIALPSQSEEMRRLGQKIKERKVRYRETSTDDLKDTERRCFGLGIYGFGGERNIGW